QTGQPKESEAERSRATLDLTRLVAAFPETVDFRRSLASTLARHARQIETRERREEAIAAYRDAMKHYTRLATENPESEEFPQARAGLLVNVGQLLASDRPAEALKEFEQALKLQPDNATILNALAWTLASGSDPAHLNPER